MQRAVNVRDRNVKNIVMDTIALSEPKKRRRERMMCRQERNCPSEYILTTIYCKIRELGFGKERGREERFI